MRLDMGVHLRAKFEVSSIILTGFRQGVVPPTSKRTPKKPTQIRVHSVRRFKMKLYYYIKIYARFRHRSIPN